MKLRIILAALCLALGTAFGSTLAAQQSVAPGDLHLAKALTLRAQALQAKDAGDYDRAAELAREAKAELALAAAAAKAPVSKAAAALPAAYTVRAIDVGEKDCLSKIAGYPFVYGDRRKWVVLYRANKATLKHPENADLILPGEVLVIPSIAGETRKGSWSEGADYPNFAAGD